MLVSEIFDDAKDVLGFPNQDKIFRRLTDAIETLANKGNWEPLLVYVSIPTVNSQYVFLPDTIEVPLRVAIDNNPAFSRGRMYEFTMNGPGPYADRVDWSWEDLANNPIILADDQGNTTGQSISDRRLIKLSRTGLSVRMLARLKTAQIVGLNNWIPLQSKMAILLMLKALESYRRGSPQDFQLGQGQEQQALKFLQEEQSSRNSYQDLAQAMDTAPLVGYTYHSNNLVVVSDIYDEATVITGGVGKSHVFDAITEAVECLANKGQWDAMTGYLTMAPNSDLIGLPRQVEIPIRINIENKPSLTRSRMFEFSANGPGTDLSDVNTLTWEDQGEGPLILPLQEPSRIGVSGVQADAGKGVIITGIDVDGLEQTHTYVIPDTDQQETSAPITWKTITDISKPITVAPVSVFANNVLITLLYPNETAPRFRQIKLSKVAQEIKIMYRRSSLQVTSVDDIIPLKSRSAILNMMRSLRLYKAPDLSPDKLQIAQALEAQSLKYLQEEEQSRLAYIQASLKDNLPALGRNYNSRGVLTSGDVYDDAADIFGAIGYQRLYDKITEGMEMLANKSQWDGLDGYVDVIADGRGYISLPRKVEVPVGMNFCRTPTQMQSKWYEFHLNGMAGCGTPCDGWTDLGEYPIIVEPEAPVRLYAITDFTTDGSAKLRAYGYDQLGNWIRSFEGGVYVDGEVIPVSVRTTHDEPVSVPVTSHYFAQVSRVSKDATNMHIELWGSTTQHDVDQLVNPPIDSPLIPPPLPPEPSPPQPPPPPPTPPNVNPPPTAIPHFLADYEAEETEPMFRRIRVPKWVTWIRMRYRMSTFKITKVSDVLNMKSKTAIVTMLRALKALESGQLDVADGLEKKAVQLIGEEQMSRNPAETFQLQFDTRTCFADPLQGQY